MAHDADRDQPHAPDDLALTLAGTLAERLCHDLAGGLGTLLGTLELACDDPAMLPEALPLARQGASGLVRRLRLLRAAWGGGEAANTAQLRELAAGIPLGRRCTLSLEALPDAAEFTASQTQLLLNVLMLAVEALAGQGEVAARQIADGEIVIAIHGTRAAWPAGLATQLLDRNAALAHAITGPRHLQAPLTAMIAHHAGIRVTLLHGPQLEGAPPLLIAFG